MGRIDTNATQYHQGLQLQEFDQTTHDQNQHHHQVNYDHHQQGNDHKSTQPQIYPPPQSPPQPPPQPHLQPQSFPPPQYHHDHQTAVPTQQAPFGCPQQPNVGLMQVNNTPQQGFLQPVSGVPAVGANVAQSPVQIVAQTQEWSSDLFDCMKDPQLGWMGNVARQQQQNQQLPMAMAPPMHQRMM